MPGEVMGSFPQAGRGLFLDFDHHTCGDKKKLPVLYANISQGFLRRLSILFIRNIWRYA